MNRFLVQIGILLALAAAALAQVATAGAGGISGTVRDASGAVIPDVAVVVTNNSKGITRQSVSNDAGLFNVPGLVPASGYGVSVEKSGFAKYTVNDIQVEVGQNVDLKIALQVASAAQQVDVTAAVPLVDTDKVGVSQVVNEAQINELPINGRRVDSFVLLTPATVPDGTFGLLSFRGIAGGNAFLTDGNDTTEQYYNENAGRTRISSQISQDAVQEFQVLSNGYSAEFGRASGGVINTVTRSGANNLHGTLYWFFRNRSLNAIDRYANGFNPPEARHQAGGSAGGALVKNKLFYFFNAETTQRDFPLVNNISDRTLFDANACVKGGATAAQCATAIQYISGFNNRIIPRSVNQNLLFGKLDFRPTDRDSFSVSLNYLRWVSPNGIQTQAVLTNNNGISGNANSAVRTRYGRASWTRVVTPTQVNEFRFGWFKDRLSDDPNSSLFPATGPLSFTLTGVALGAPQAYPRVLPSENRFEFADNYSWTAGRHNLKFGADILLTEDYSNQIYNRFGNYSYTSLAAFAQDYSGNTTGQHYSNFTQAFGNPILDFNTNDYDFFIQDQWKLTPKLTVNMGLRYEYTQLQQPKQFNTDYPQTKSINTSMFPFAPRFSVSYGLNDKTVIRSGFGIFYSRIQGSLLSSLYLNNGLYQPTVFVQNNTAGAPVFPNVFSSPVGLPAGSTNLEFASQNLRKPYVMQSDFAIERQLTSTLGLTLSYIWSRGVQFFTVRDLNMGPLSNDYVTYQVAADPAGQNIGGSYATRVYRSKNDRRYNQILFLDNGGQTWYNAFVAQLQKRFSHGFQASVAYTYSHAIDDFNQGGGSNVVIPGISTVYNGDYGFEKGTSALDQRHRATITWIWAPTFYADSWWKRNIVNGWELSQLTTLATPQSTAPVVNVPTGTSYPGLVNNNTLNGFGGSTRVPFLPLSSEEIDSVHRVDARLTKQFVLTERFKLNLFFEAFNVFNTISNTGIFNRLYNLSYNSATGLRTLLPVSNYGLGNASQGFPDGTNARRMQAGLRFTF